MGDRARAKWVENTSVLPAASITAVTPQRSCGIIKRFIVQPRVRDVDVDRATTLLVPIIHAPLTPNVNSSVCKV